MFGYTEKISAIKTETSFFFFYLDESKVFQYFGSMWSAI